MTTSVADDPDRPRAMQLLRHAGERRVHAAQRVDRVVDVLLRVRRRERQREHLGAGPLGDRQRRLVGKRSR